MDSLRSITGWFLLFGCLGGGIFFTVILFRYRRIKNLYACWFLGGMGSLILYASSSWAMGDVRWIRILSFLLFLVPVFHLLNMAVTARRVRICVALATHPQGLSENKLIKSLQLGSVTTHRIQILRQFAQVKVSRRRVLLVRREFLCIAFGLNFIKKILGLPEIA
ncbi:MAG: hypothetical protein EBX50_15320 [Chitinophagia bacterium]|nr:hypothetical protein [Chitinophagia bacterium]